MNDKPIVEFDRNQQQQLEKSINSYLKWLNGTLDGRVTQEYEVIKFAKPSREDWIMKVSDRERGVVMFNPFITKKCSFAYFELTVLHECFHLFVQNLPNKNDAKRLKDDFGDDMMKLLDIEADFYTALFYKEKTNASLIDIFKLYYEGSQAFGDPKIRSPKLERFIGTVLSVAKAYFDYPGKKAVEHRVRYLPDISNVPTDDTLHVLVSNGAHNVVEEIAANFQDFAEIKKCYTTRGQYSEKGYVEQLICFSSKALRQQVPKQIQKQLSARV